MNLGEGIWELGLTNDLIFCLDSLQETNIMITSKQDMWIIRFEHDNGSFQSNQRVLYEFNLRSLSFDHKSNISIVINKYLWFLATSNLVDIVYFSKSQNWGITNHANISSK